MSPDDATTIGHKDPGRERIAPQARPEEGGFWAALVYDYYRKRFWPLPRKQIVVRCGDPIDLSAYRDRPVTTALLREVTDHLMGAVRELLADVRGEPAPLTFYRGESHPTRLARRACS